MNIEEMNYQRLEDLALQHRTYFVTPALSAQIEEAGLEEMILYGYGTLAGSDEAEERREGMCVNPHEGFWDCEVSPHFWRGVCEARGAEIGMPFNKKPRKKTETEGSRYARFKVRGTHLLLWRLYEFFERYSAYPQVACRYFEDQIDADKGFVLLSGQRAQMAIYSLYHGASVGALVGRAKEIMKQQPLSGWGIGDQEWGSHRPMRPDLSGLKPMAA
jgi:hypothetical protein